MSSLRIHVRLTIVSSTIIFLLFVSGGLSLRQLQNISHHTDSLIHLDQQANAVLRVYNNSLHLHALIHIEEDDEGLKAANIHTSGVRLLESIPHAITTLQSTEIYAIQNKDHIDQLNLILAQLPSQLDQFEQSLTQKDTEAHQQIVDEFCSSVESIDLIAEKIDKFITTEHEATVVGMENAEQQAVLIILATVVLTIAATGLLSFIIIRSITRPLRQLDQAAQAWAHGDISSRVVVNGQDELAHLGKVFNEGAARLSDLYTNQEELVKQRTAELESRAVQLETSAALSQRITSLLDVDLLLQEASNLIHTNFSFDYVGVFLVEPQTDQLLLRADNTGSPVPIRLPQDNSNIIGWVATHHQPKLISNKQQTVESQYRSHRSDTQTELALPLMMGGDLLGVLDIQCLQPYCIAESDIPVFLGLAAQISIAINNASIYKEELTQRQFAETLQNIGRDLTSTLNMSEVLDLILARVKTLLPYDRASILLWQGGELEIQAAIGFPPDSSPLQTKVPISEDQDDVFVRLYHSKRPLIINSVANYPSWRGVEKIPLPGSWLGVPLIRDNEAIGMLSLTHLEENIYTEQDAHTATAVASHAAVAVANAQYYMQIKAFSEQLEYEVQNRTHALRNAYEQLERLDSTKESFISVASHELRTPITVLKGYSQLLIKDPVLEKSTYYSNLLQGMLKGVNRMHEIIDSMLDMAKIDGRTLRVYPESISIYTFVRELLDSLDEALQDRDIAITIEPDLLRLPSIEADHDGLKKILYHLIINAIKYTPDGGKITINGWAWHSRMDRVDWPDKGVEIIISDTGIGIDPHALESIFHKFYQTGEVALHSSGKTKFKGGGSGLGLAIVKGFVEAHQGLVWAESEKHDEALMPGSRFHVVLPLNQEKNQLALKIDDLTL